MHNNMKASLEEQGSSKPHTAKIKVSLARWLVETFVIYYVTWFIAHYFYRTFFAIDLEPMDAGAYVGNGVRYSTWGKFTSSRESIESLREKTWYPRTTMPSKLGL